MILSSRKHFEQKIVAKAIESKVSFEFKTGSDMNRVQDGMLEPFKEKKNNNILKVRNLDKQYTHQIWCQTAGNLWRYAPEGCLFDSGFLTK